MAFDPQAFIANPDEDTKSSGFDPRSFVEESAIEKASDPDFDPRTYAIEHPDSHDFAREVAWHKENAPMTANRALDIGGRFVKAVPGVAKDMVIGAADIAKDVGYGIAGSPAEKERALTQNIARAQLIEKNDTRLVNNLVGPESFLGRHVFKYVGQGMSNEAAMRTGSPELRALSKQGQKEMVSDDAERAANPRKFFDNKFDQDVEELRKERSIASGQVSNEGIIASGIKAATGQDPANIVSTPQQFSEMGLPINPDSITRAASTGDVVNLLPLHVPVVSNLANKAAGALVEGGGKVLSKVGAPIAEHAAEKLTGPAVVGAMIHGGPALGIKTALAGGALWAAGKGAKVIGDIAQDVGKEARTGVAGELSTKIGESAVKGTSATGAKLAKRAGETVIGSVAAPMSMLPLNLFIADSPEQFMELEGGAVGIGAVGGATRFRLRPEIVRNADAYLQREGDAPTGDKSLDEKHAAFIQTLDPAIAAGVRSLRGFFNGMTGKSEAGSRSKTKLFVLSTTDFIEQARALDPRLARASVAELATQRGVFIGNKGIALINGEHGRNQIPGEMQHTAGHETGGHAAENILRFMSERGSPMEASVQSALADGLFENGKPTAEFKKFIDAYKKKAPTNIQTKPDTDPYFRSEFLSETAAQILQGKGAAEFAVPQGVADKIMENLGNWWSKLIGVEPGLIKGNTKFSREQVGAINSAMGDALREIGRVKFRSGQQQPSASAEVGPQPTNPTPAGGQAAGQPAPAPVTPTAPAVDPLAIGALRNKVANALQKGLGMTPEEARAWARVAEGDDEATMFQDVIAKRFAQQRAQKPATAAPESIPAPTPTQGKQTPPATAGEQQPALAAIPVVEKKARLLQELKPGETGMQKKATRAGDLELMRNEGWTNEELNLMPLEQFYSEVEAIRNKLAADGWSDEDIKAMEQPMPSKQEAPSKPDIKSTGPMRLGDVAALKRLGYDRLKIIGDFEHIPGMSQKERARVVREGIHARDYEGPPEQNLSEIPLPNEKPQTQQEPALSAIPATAVAEPPSAAPAPAGVESEPATALPSPTEIAARLSEAEKAAQPKIARARTPGRKAEIAKEERVAALTAMLGGEGLARTVDPETGEVSFRGNVDPSNPVHKAILDEFGYTPDQISDITTLQNRTGEGVYLRDYNSAEQEGYETGPVDFTGKKRGEEYEKSRAGKQRGQREGGVSKQDKPFTPFATLLTKTGVNIRGFDHDKFLNNVRAIIDSAHANGIATGYENLKGADLDAAIAKDFRDVTTNHKNGNKNTGEPLKTFPDTGIFSNMDRVGIPVDPQRAAVINMALHNRSAKPPGEPRGKTELAARKNAKAKAKSLEAIGLADLNSGFLDTATGETNKLRSDLEQAGFDTDKILKPTISNVRPDLIEGGIHDTPTHGKSVHAHGFDIAAKDLTAEGVPSGKITAAGFMPSEEGAARPSEEDQLHAAARTGSAEAIAGLFGTKAGQETLRASKEGALSSFETKNTKKEEDYKPSRRPNGSLMLSADEMVANHPEVVGMKARKAPLSETQGASARLHAGARTARDAAFYDAISKPPTKDDQLVIMAAGGPGSGKSTSLRQQTEPAIIYDTNLRDPKKAQRMIDAAIKSGRNVELRYIHRPFEDAVRGNILRASDEGRIATADDISQGHNIARDSMETLIENNRDNPNVEFNILNNDGDFSSITPEQLSVMPRPLVDELTKRAYSAADEHTGKEHAEAVRLFRGLEGGGEAADIRGVLSSQLPHQGGKAAEGAAGADRAGTRAEVAGQFMPSESGTLTNLTIDKLQNRRDAIQQKIDAEWYKPKPNANKIQALRDEKQAILSNIEDKTVHPKANQADDREGIRGPSKDRGSDVPKGHIAFSHWSRAEGIETIDPSRHGTGAIGAESKRRTNYPDRYVDRSYIGYGDYKKEPALGKHRYDGTIDDRLLYDIESDPLELSELAVASAERLGPDKTDVATELERAIREHGFLGYKSDRNQSAAIFHRIPAGGEVGMDAFRKASPEYARRAPEMLRALREMTPEFDSIEEGYFDQQPVDHKRSNQIARNYDKLVDNNIDNPNVRRAHEALADKVLEQSDELLKKVDVEPWADKQKDGTWKSRLGQPYGDSTELQNDLRDGHLYFFITTPETYGSKAKAFDPRDPMTSETGRETKGGYPLLYNDVLRYVHDAIAHGAFGVQFGPNGEEAAWRAHMATISDPWARWALTTATRGQNSWVNFRDEYMKRGRPLKKGDEGYIKPQDRPFADQKTDLIDPEWMLTGDRAVDAAVKDDPEFVNAAFGSKEKFQRGEANVEALRNRLNGRFMPSDNGPEIDPTPYHDDNGKLIGWKERDAEHARIIAAIKSAPEDQRRKEAFAQVGGLQKGMRNRLKQWTGKEDDSALSRLLYMQAEGYHGREALSPSEVRKSFSIMGGVAFMPSEESSSTKTKNSKEAEDIIGEMPGELNQETRESISGLRARVKDLEGKVTDEFSYEKYSQVKQELRRMEFEDRNGAPPARMEEVDAILSPISQLQGKWKRGKKIADSSIFGEKFEADGDGHLFRSVTESDWDRIKKQGYIDSDGRSAIDPTNEGINMGEEPQTAAGYIPLGGRGVVLAINPKGLIGLFKSKVDDYVRTTKRIPIENIVAYSPLLGRDKEFGQFYIPKEASFMPSEDTQKVLFESDSAKDIRDWQENYEFKHGVEGANDYEIISAHPEKGKDFDPDRAGPFKIVSSKFMPSEDSSSTKTKNDTDELGFYSALGRAVKSPGFPDTIEDKSFPAVRGRVIPAREAVNKKTGEKIVIPERREADKPERKESLMDQASRELEGTGAKQEEIDWLGLDQFLEGRKSVTKEELSDFIDSNRVQLKEVVKGGIEPFIQRDDENDSADVFADESEKKKLYTIEGKDGTDFAIYDADGKMQKLGQKYHPDMDSAIEAIREKMGAGDSGGTKHSQRQLPGGTNYKEKLYTLPNKELTELPSDYTIKEVKGNKNSTYPYTQDRFSVSRNDRPGEVGSGKTREEAIASALKAINHGVGFADRRNEFSSTHWDEPNVIGHTREADHTDTEGNKVRLIEEVQSDWHQKGRKEGYKGDPVKGYSIQEKDGKFYTYKDGSDSPNSVHDTRQQAQDSLGYSSIPDAPFKKSWHELLFKKALRSAVEDGMDKLAWTTGDTQNERYDLSKQVDDVLVWESNTDGLYHFEARKDGRVVVGEMDRAGITKEKLADSIGKELAQKATDDLANGKKALYSGDDLKIGGGGMKGFYDKILPDFARKYVKKWGGKVETTTLESATKEIPDNKYKAGMTFDDFGVKVHSIAITPEMRESVKAGQSMFMPSDAPPEQIKRKRDAVAQAAWMAKKATENTLKLNENPDFAIDLAKKWRQDHHYDSTEDHGIPEGFLRETPLPSEAVSSDGARTSREAFIEQNPKAGEAERRAAAVQPLRDAAEATGRVFGPELRKLAGDEGAEHQVLLLPKRVLKITYPGQFGAKVEMGEQWVPEANPADAADYLERVKLFNEAFGDDIRVEGVMDNKDGTHSIVTSQQTLNGVQPTAREAAKAMKAGGFIQISDRGFYNPESNIYAHDLHLGNFVKVDSGDVIPIDAMMTQPEVGSFLRNFLNKRVDQVKLGEGVLGEINASSFMPSSIQTKNEEGGLFAAPTIRRITNEAVKAIAKKKAEKFPEAIPVTYKRDENGAVIPGDNGRPQPVKTQYDLHETPLAKQAMKGIRGDAPRHEAMVDAYAGKLEEMVHASKDNESIQRGAKWYAEARQGIRALLGEDSELFTQLLAATSPQTPVSENYNQAIQAYNGLKSGKYDTAIKRYLELLPKLEDGEPMRFRKTVTDAIGRKVAEPGDFVTRNNFKYYLDSEDILPRKDNGKKFNQNSGSVLNVLAGMWAKTEGLKVSNFAQNLFGTGNEATIDIWAARAMHRAGHEGMADRWRILPEAETSVSDSDFKISQDAYHKAAKSLGINADALQGILWFAEKDLWDKRKWTKGTGAEKSDFNSLLNQTVNTGKKLEIRKNDQQGLLFEIPAR